MKPNYSTLNVVASKPQEQDGWINSASASRYLGISLVTLRRWVRQKRVTPKRTPTGEYRFRRSELDALLA
ncbi:MAG: helix-turn-helix domain-containing protein [Luteolibacter sp.]